MIDNYRSIIIDRLIDRRLGILGTYHMCMLDNVCVESPS